MPAEAIEAIKAESSKGWSVVVEAPSCVRAREVFEALARSVGEEAQTIIRASGRECITTALGSEIRVTTHPGHELRVILT